MSAPSLDLKHIREVLAASTAGPWSACHDGDCSCGIVFGDGGDTYVAKTLRFSDDVDPVATPPARKANTKFIASARTWVPALVDRITELTDALGAIRAWLGVIADKIDLDPDGTRVTINAVGPNGKREVAARSLRDIYEQADAALSNPKEAAE